MKILRLTISRSRISNSSDSQTLLKTSTQQLCHILTVKNRMLRITTARLQRVILCITSANWQESFWFAVFKKAKTPFVLPCGVWLINICQMPIKPHPRNRSSWSCASVTLKEAFRLFSQWQINNKSVFSCSASSEELCSCQRKWFSRSPRSQSKLLAELLWCAMESQGLPSLPQMHRFSMQSPPNEC